VGIWSAAVRACPQGVEWVRRSLHAAHAAATQAFVALYPGKQPTDGDAGLAALTTTELDGVVAALARASGNNESMFNVVLSDLCRMCHHDITKDAVQIHLVSLTQEPEVVVL